MKKLLAYILLFLIVASPSYAALPATLLWEIEYGSTAANVNGCGYDTQCLAASCTGAATPCSACTGAGTTASVDYTQTTGAALNPTDLAMTTGGTTLTSAASTFTAAMVGNLIHITTTGTGAHFVIGWYEITAYTDAHTVTIDRDATTGGNGVAGTGYVGGACPLGSTTSGMTDSNLLTAAVAGNTFFVKYSASNYVLAAATVAGTNGTNVAPINFIGYNTTRTTTNLDTSIPSFRSAAWTFGVANYWLVRNIDISSTNASATVSLGGSSQIRRSKIGNTAASGTPYGVSSSSSIGTAIINCEVTTTLGIAIGLYSSGKAIGNYVHDSPAGIKFNGSSGAVIGNFIDKCTTGVFIANNYASEIIYGNTIRGAYTPTGTGISGLVDDGRTVANNIICGFTTGVTHTANYQPIFADYNMWGNNASGCYNTTDIDPGKFTKGPHDVNLDPGFATSGSAFTTDATPGVNAKGVGFQGTFPGTTSTSYMDIGAVQRQEPTSTAGVCASAN